MCSKLRSNKGITMIALIITIIILLILAGVSIATLTESGLFEKARQAEQKSENAQIKEETTLGEYENKIDEVLGTRDSVTISKTELESLVNQLVDKKMSGEAKNPAGTVISYMAGSTAPSGYLACDGTVYNISDYPTLAEAINIGFGKYNYYGGDGTTTFAVPDLRGEFLRGTGTATRNTGSGAAVGGHQNPTQHLLIRGSADKNLNWSGGTNGVTNYEALIGSASTTGFWTGARRFGKLDKTTILHSASNKHISIILYKILI